MSRKDSVALGTTGFFIVQGHRAGQRSLVTFSAHLEGHTASLGSARALTRYKVCSKGGPRLQLWMGRTRGSH